MKSTTIPPLRVTPELRRAAEAVLQEGETLSGFMLEALQKAIAHRRDQRAFVERGLASAARAKRTGRHVSADAVLKKLEHHLAAARSRKRKKHA